MNMDEIMEKNLTYSFEFSLYVLQHPDFAGQIPANSRIVLLPGDDPELAQINRESAESARQIDDEPNRPTVYVAFERLAPARSRIERPHLIPRPLVSS
ncbi:hypothetical protein FBQ82_00845 [Anaerolineae bacterium CFX7]|nr:hypothetical protein [Anaerolineae bacterium CFX7]